ncbi:MAG TPA: acylphosphatase [Chloroflexi bacterium]|jgi:acylphosphatase|nr:acylphosphatase [Chloroflexota bacterium]
MTEERPGTAERRRVRALVHGRVQGVNFRSATLEKARALGLKGYVANRWDGTVEVVAEGREAAIEALLRWLHSGPPLAHVERVQTNWQAPNDDFNAFTVRS